VNRLPFLSPCTDAETWRSRRRVDRWTLVAVRESPDIVRGLRRSYLFEGLSADQLAPLAAVVTTRRVARGESVCRVGDDADEIYMVLSGEVKDSVVDADGCEVVHFLHGPGMTFGEPGFFALDHRRIVEVIATEPTVLLRLGRREFVPYMARYPVIKDHVLAKLASNQRWQTTMISSLATKSLIDRLVLRLLELVDSSPQRRDGLSITPRVSQTTLAAMIGVTRENVNRALATLMSSGAIRQENSRYVLVDEEGLRRRVARGVGPVAARHDRRSGSPTDR
jgi:CRP/FNR family transcriptional regulator, cyclic AMP receptor protein